MRRKIIKSFHFKYIEKNRIKQPNAIYALTNNNKKICSKLIISNLILLFITAFPILTKKHEDIFRYNFSYITLTLNGKGKKSIFYDEDGNSVCNIFQPPNEVHINDINQSNVNYEYTFNESKNIVKLIWHNKVTTTNCLFYKCKNVDEIDLSHFDSSSISGKIIGMFGNCESLISLDLSTFNISQVTDISHMFAYCYKLTSLNLSNFNTSKIERMFQLFHKCQLLTSLDLSSFDTSKVETMGYMFSGCKSLTSINLSNFNTPEISNISHMFQDCENLNSVNLSSFNFSKTIHMTLMFGECFSIKTIYFSNSETPELEYLGSIFRNCISLVSVDLSYFTTKKLKNIDNMFFNCSSLTSVNLSNFNTSTIILTNSIFEGCVNLEYVNLKNLGELSDNNYQYQNAFQGTPENMVICINETIAPRLTELIRRKDKTCYIIDCRDDWKSIQRKKNSEYKGCTDNCTNNINHIYQFQSLCKPSCQHGTYYDSINSVKKCKCQLDKCLLCANIEPVKDLCISCNKYYYPMENDPSNIGTYINCYNNLEGYYLDKSDENHYIYKLCFERCKSCEIGGDVLNHNCIECNSNYSFGISKNNYTNCYINCSYYYFFDDYGNYHCTDDFSCPQNFSKLQVDRRECKKHYGLDKTNEYEFLNKSYEYYPKESTEFINREHYSEVICNEENPFIIVKTQVCVDFCDIDAILSKSCVLKYIVETNKDSDERRKEEKDIEEIRTQEIKAQDKILDNIEKGFTSENFNTSNIENGNDVIIKDKKMTITLTTSDNQKNNSNNNVTTIDLGDCEDILRKAYNISKDKKLYMKKIDMMQEGMKIPKVEYDVYCKLNGSNLIKLNLSFCKNSKIGLSVPVVITESLDKLNTSSGYYNDLCYVSTSDSGTDIILEDRKKEFIKGNKTVCQDNCDFTKYDYNIQKAECSCDIKESSSSTAFMYINKTKLFENFMDIKNIANIKLLLCYRTLFNKDGIKHNIGSLTIIPLIIFHLVCIIIFYKDKLVIIKKRIKDIIFGIKNWKLVKAENRLKRRKKKSEMSKKEREEKEKAEKSEKINKDKESEDKKEINIVPQFGNSYTEKIKSIELAGINQNPPYKIKKKKHQIVINNNNLNASNNVRSNNIIQVNQEGNQINEKGKETIIQKARDVMAYNDLEKNLLSYKLALRYDKRTYCEYYISLIKTKHILIFSFYYNNDYNERVVKMDLFFVIFIIYFAVNALFFNDNTMHKIYEDKGRFHFEYQLPQILYN